MLHVISLGAGVQSSAMALMICHEVLDVPPIDCAIFADTGAEPDEVYRWLDWLERKLPFRVHRVSCGSLFAHEIGASMRKGDKPIMVPYRSPNERGEMGIVRRQCTNHFKIAPIDRKLKELRNGGPVTLYQGISYDELSRMKPARQKYKTHAYPLVDARLTRGHCLEWMDRMGYPEPPRSACFFCPLKGPAEWRKMQIETPDTFDAACMFDEHMRNRGGDRPLYVWREPVPLRDVDFRSAEEMGQQSMFEEDCEGLCGV